MAKKKRKKEAKRRLPRVSFDRVFVCSIAAFVFILPLFIWPGETEYGYGKSIIAFLVVSLLLIAWAARGIGLLELTLS